MSRERPLGERLWAAAIWALVGFFILNLFAMIAAVVVSSFAHALARHLAAGRLDRRAGTARAWDEFQLDDVLIVTFEVVGAVVLISGPARRAGGLCAGAPQFSRQAARHAAVPAAAAGPADHLRHSARHRAVPDRSRAARCRASILANLVPTVPFVILVMIPFIEQIDPRIEAAARVFGANTLRLFIHVLIPLLLPGILAALLLVLVRTIAMFELTFLTAGPTSQTLVVALYYAVFAAGVRAVQSIDAMAVIYMVTTLIWLLIALRFVNPTQIVARAKRAA